MIGPVLPAPWEQATHQAVPELACARLVVTARLDL